MVGLYTYYYRCLEYPYLDIPLIVGLTVGIGTPLLILTIFAICFCRRCRRKRKQNGRDEDHQNLPTTENHELQENPIFDNSSEVEVGTSGLESGAGKPGFSSNYGVGKIRGQRLSTSELPGKRFSLGGLADGLDPRKNRNRKSRESPPNDAHDHEIPDDGYDKRIGQSRTSMYPPESTSSADEDDDGYDSRISYSTDKPLSSGLQRKTIFPPTFGGLEVLQEEPLPVSNRDSEFPPPGKNAISGKFSPVKGSRNLNKILEVEVLPSMEAPIATESYLNDFAQNNNKDNYNKDIYNKDNYDRQISLVGDLDTTGNRQSVFPPLSDPDGAHNTSTTIRVDSNRDSMFPPSISSVEN